MRWQGLTVGEEGFGEAVLKAYVVAPEAPADSLGIKVVGERDDTPYKRVINAVRSSGTGLEAKDLALEYVALYLRTRSHGC